MHSLREGNGPRLFVGLHGWAGTMAAFEPLLPHLPPGATLVRFDLPGCGRSPGPASWDLQAIADEAASAIADEIEASGVPVENMTLVGNCSGALFALLAARRLGGRVSRLVLVDPFARLPAWLRIFAAPGWGRPAYFVTFENPVGRWITNASLAHRRSGGTHLTRFFEKTDHEANRMYLRMFARAGSLAGASMKSGESGESGQAGEAGATRAALEDLRGMSVPVELVYGSRTFAAVKRAIPAWRELFPQARAIEVPGAGHLPMRDAPGALAAIIFGAPTGSTGPGASQARSARPGEGR